MFVPLTTFFVTGGASVADASVIFLQCGRVQYNNAIVSSIYQEIGQASYHLPLNSSTQDAEAASSEFEASLAQSAQ